MDLDPLVYIRRYESGGRYMVGYGGADLSRSTLGLNGFPQWSGVQTGKGWTHAAGAYQFEPATWARYAGPLGIHDFSPVSQDRVARACYDDVGFSPWAPYDPRLAAAIVSAKGRFV